MCQEEVCYVLRNTYKFILIKQHLGYLQLGNCVPKVPFCVVDALRSQVHWRLHTDDVGFACALIWCHAHLTQKGAQTEENSSLTHVQI